MLTKNEISTLALSPTKKDFVQIWNELLDVASKLSERWDPTSTNESDPGIVLLKTLAGIADRLNYNIDKNILEAYMPTAAQEESMRKLCDMLGYAVKYYQSAVTDVTIKYYNANPSETEASIMKSTGITIPKFMSITNVDGDINYFTINDTDIIMNSLNNTQTVKCMEGQVVKCESINKNNLITTSQITDNNRFYLPETSVAENGIFVYNSFILDSADTGSVVLDGEKWTKVDNLNIQSMGMKVFKFGIDSTSALPYLEFPKDFSSLFGEGIFIYYTRTSGRNGNVSANTLTQLVPPTSWSDIATESFSVTNNFAATSGSDKETIDQAYNNFKRTIGTFETLVTCRDYMNKIYSLTNSNNKSIVSNILVTDIRNDLNRAVTICSCDEFGIFYKEQPIVKQSKKPIFYDNKWQFEEDGIVYPLDAGSFMTNYIENSKDPSTGYSFIESFTGVEHKVDLPKIGEIHITGVKNTVQSINGYWYIRQDYDFKKTLDEKITQTDFAYFKTNLVDSDTQLIDNFEIVFYPYKNYNQLNSTGKDINTAYDTSFEYTDSSFKVLNPIKNALSEVKTIAHKIVTPDVGHVLSINNYLRLNAFISTTSKVTVNEGNIIIENIKKALASAFNMRELDFGEEIPFDSILNVIEKADSRIRVAALQEPALYTTFSVLNGHNNNGIGDADVVEYAVASEWLSNDIAKTNGKILELDSADAKRIYNKLALRNVLAGRLPLFNYDSTFNVSFEEAPYRVTEIIDSSEVSDLKIEPDATEPFSILETEDGTIYTGQYIKEDDYVYTKTYTPESINLLNNDKGNLESFSQLDTSCELSPGALTSGAPLTLENGEFVKFRAPKLVTKLTYPAYVNYNLVLNSSNTAEAEPAEVRSLAEFFNNELVPVDGSTSAVGWASVFDYFKKLDETNEIKTVETVELKLSVSVSAESNDASGSENAGSSTYTIKVSSQSENTTEDKLSELLRTSGCLKLASPKAEVSWEPTESQTAPSDQTGIEFELDISDLSNGEYITDYAIISEIQRATQEQLNILKENTEVALPTECDWAISYTFESVPITTNTLDSWSQFIRALSTKNKIYTEDSVALWRKFDNSSYSTGKYIYDGHKYLYFERSTLNSLNKSFSSLFENIYILIESGKDAVYTEIKNSQDYELREGEKLYIEYTPSSTSTDGTTTSSESKTEYYGPGTIIRPSGFTNNLCDSSHLADLGYSPDKQIRFNINDITEDVKLYSLGTNEQIEIREYSKVELSSATLSNTQMIYLYKNFDCPIFENISLRDSDINYVEYQLKDGEYLFYTDQNKNDAAFFSSGTLVRLEGNVIIPRAEELSLSAAQYLSLDDIPWSPVTLKDNKIICTDYTYITLGAGDLLTSVELVDGPETTIDNSWKACKSATYNLASDLSTKHELPLLALSGLTGCGWDVCSVLELNSSPYVSQTLRSTDSIKTSIMPRTVDDLGGGIDKSKSLTPENSDGGASGPGKLSFKTNLFCYSNGTTLNIDDLSDDYQDTTEGFKFRVFTKAKPSIVRTLPGSVIPFGVSKTTDNTSRYVDILDEAVIQELPDKSSTELWTSVALKDIQIYTEETNTKGLYAGDKYDKALRLSVNLLPNTYGIACFYLNYTTDSTKETGKTWIETIPSIDNANSTFELLNDLSDITLNNIETTSAHKLQLNPGINCVRINKSGTYYIKTNCTQGSFLFDDLKLVKVDSIVLDKVGKLSTYGLNLKQLDYQYIPATDIDSLNNKNIQATMLLNKFLNDLRDREIEYARKANDAATYILESREELAEYPEEKQLICENSNYLLNTFATADKTDFTASFKNLVDTRNKLLVANARLQEASTEIDDCRTTAYLEQDLAELSKNLGIGLSTEQHDDLISNIEATIAQLQSYINSSTLHNNAALAGYTKDTFTTAISKFVSIDNDRYLEAQSWLVATLERMREYALNEVSTEISTLATRFETEASGNLKNELKPILTEIKNLSYSKDLATISNLISQLQSISNSRDPLAEDSISSMLSTMESAALTGNYSDILMNISKFRRLLSTQTQTELVNLLVSTVSSADNIPEISKLVEELSTVESLLTSEINGNIDDIITDVTAYNACLDLVYVDAENGKYIPKGQSSWSANITLPGGSAFSSVTSVTTNQESVFLRQITNLEKAIKGGISKLTGALESRGDNNTTGGVLTRKFNGILEDLNEVLNRNYDSTLDKITELENSLSELSDAKLREIAEDLVILVGIQQDMEFAVNFSDIYIDFIRKTTAIGTVSSDETDVIALINSLMTIGKDDSDSLFYEGYFYDKVLGAAWFSCEKEFAISILNKFIKTLKVNSKEALEKLHAIANHYRQATLLDIQDISKEVFKVIEKIVETDRYAEAVSYLEQDINEDLGIKNALEKLLGFTVQENADFTSFEPTSSNNITSYFGKLNGLGRELYYEILDSEATEDITTTESTEATESTTSTVEPLQSRINRKYKKHTLIQEFLEEINQITITNTALISAIEDKIFKFTKNFGEYTEEGGSYLNDWLSEEFEDYKGRILDYITCDYTEFEGANTPSIPISFDNYMVDKTQDLLNYLNGCANVATVSFSSLLEVLYDCVSVDEILESLKLHLAIDGDIDVSQLTALPEGYKLALCDLVLYYSMNNLLITVFNSYSSNIDVLTKGAVITATGQAIANLPKVEVDGEEPKPGAAYPSKLDDYYTKYIDENNYTSLYNEQEQITKTLNDELTNFGELVGACNDIFSNSDTENSAEIEAFRNVYNLELQLLSDIRRLDKHKAFYYSAPVDQSIMIDISSTNGGVKSLAHPAAYYDPNNINNNFVISKIDMNYLVNGIQLSRSSRLN